MSRVCLVALALALTSPLSAQWRTTTSRDEITGAQSSYALSPAVRSTEPMGFPYQGTTAWLGVGCTPQSAWAFVGFSQAPNLVNTDTHDGYESLRTRARWDDEVQSVTLTQRWGEAFLHFQDDRDAIRRIRAASLFLVEIPWFGEGATYFRFSLAGSSAAMSQIGCPTPDSGLLPGPEGAAIVGDPLLMIYAPLNIRCGQRMAESSRAVFFADPGSAEAAGYRPSAGCPSLTPRP